MEIIRVELEIAKSVFHVYAVARNDEPQLQAKVIGDQWLDAFCVSDVHPERKSAWKLAHRHTTEIRISTVHDVF